MMAISLLLLLLAAELSLRAYHQLTMRARLPEELRAETRTIAWQGIEDKYRIVCFGDSITFGEDLPYHQSYPAVLAGLLRDRYPNLDMEVINAGIGGHTSVQGLARLERDVLWYKPHLVIVAFGINDGHLGHWPLDPIRERRMRGDLHLWERIDSLLRHSHIYQTVRGRTRRLLRRLGWRQRPSKVYTEGDPQPRVSLESFKMAQQRLVKRIQDKGTAAVLLSTITPVTEVFQADLKPSQKQRQWDIYVEYSRAIRDIASQNGAHLLDLRAIFEARAQKHPSSFPPGREAYASLLTEDGVHLTPEGEQLIAVSVLRALEGIGLPGSDPYRRR